SGGRGPLRLSSRSGAVRRSGPVGECVRTEPGQAAESGMIDLEVGGKRERIRPGLHICQFYNQPIDISQTAIPFLRDGLRGNDKCYFAAPTARLDEVRKTLRASH